MLHYKTFNHTEPTKEWVTFIHGAGGSSSIWFKQIRDFSQYFNVLLIDLRGHGNSKKGEIQSNYTFHSVTTDVLEVLDQLKISSSHFVGISLGTIIIREIAEIAPERINKMVLGGAIMKFNLRGRFLMTLGDWFKSFMPYMLLYKLFAFVIMPQQNHKEARSLFVNEARKLAQKEFVRWYKLTASVNKVLKFHRAKDPEIPTLFIMGSEDYMFLEPIKEIVRQHKKAALQVINECGHVVNVEKPQQFNRIAINYLQS